MRRVQLKRTHCRENGFIVSKKRFQLCFVDTHRRRLDVATRSGQHRRRGTAWRITAIAGAVSTVSEALPLSPRPPAVWSGRVFGRDTRGDNFLGDGTGGTNCESLGGYTRFAAVLANAHALLQGDGCFRPTLVGGAVGRHGIAKGPRLAAGQSRAKPGDSRRNGLQRHLRAPGGSSVPLYVRPYEPEQPGVVQGRGDGLSIPCSRCVQPKTWPQGLPGMLLPQLPASRHRPDPH
jgi:hypothetical protein